MIKAMRLFGQTMMEARDAILKVMGAFFDIMDEEPEEFDIDWVIYEREYILTYPREQPFPRAPPEGSVDSYGPGLLLSARV